MKNGMRSIFFGDDSKTNGRKTAWHSVTSFPHKKINRPGIIHTQIGDKFCYYNNLCECEIHFNHILTCTPQEVTPKTHSYMVRKQIHVRMAYWSRWSEL